MFLCSQVVSLSVTKMAVINPWVKSLLQTLLLALGFSNYQRGINQQRNQEQKTI